MNKVELIAALAEKSGCSKKDAGSVLDAFTEVVEQTLAKGDKITLVGFGSFETQVRAARTGKNPRTGEVLNIPESRVPKFKPGAGLKAKVGA